jgi:hypothetical protein
MIWLHCTAAKFRSHGAVQSTKSAFMNKQTQKPLGIFLEGPRTPYRSVPRTGWRWTLIFLLLAALVLFVGHEMRNRKSISPHQAPPAEMSPAPGRAPVASQSLPAEPKPAPAIPSATPQPVAPAPLPAEVTLLQAVSLTVKREGRVVGVVHLQPGQRVTPISVSGGMMSVALGDAAGSVPVGSTDYGRQHGGMNERREKAR